MLKTLSVQNYALIDELQLNFGDGLNIITGETGAGKSVLMGALGLLLGDRADSSALLDKAKKCIIEGVFISSKKIRVFLENAELDSDDEVIIHREITRDGKSRAFINDTPVNLSLLKELGDELVDIHSQHETLLLNKSNFQLSVVDAFAGHQQSLEDFRVQFKKYKQLKAELSDLIEEERKASSEQDYIQFQFNELEEAGLQQDEQKSLEEELSSLTHAGEIIANVNQFSSIVSEAEANVISGLSSASAILSGLTKYTTHFESMADRMRAAVIELKDIQEEVSRAAEDISVNPSRLETVTARLDLIYRLQQKHRLNDVGGLIELRESLSEKLLSFSSLNSQIESARKELEKVFTIIKSKSAEISSNRQKAIPVIESKIKKLLAEVSMPDAVLKVELTQLTAEEMNSTGADKIRFLFSANKGVQYSDISKVASGGELSRLMLCIKSSVAKLIDMPTIVFDEIDTGVSGETGFKIGKVMLDLSKSRQLLAITHLPQIAGRGEDHFFVYKEVTGKKTFTRVKKLSKDERVVEVAKMLSGDKPTAVAMENARELLKN
jgi:DNA repair protein RecN (Recombination protein N)